MRTLRMLMFVALAAMSSAADVIDVESEWSYLGAFKLPDSDGNGRGPENSFRFPEWGLAYDSDSDALYVVGHAHHRRIAKVTIPTPVTGGTFDTLPEAQVLIPLTSIPLESDCLNVRATGGLAIYKGRLLFQVRDWYHVGRTGPCPTMGAVALDLDPLTVRGLWQIARFDVNRVMGTIGVSPTGRVHVGFNRGAGAFGGVQGPNLIVLDDFDPAAQEPNTIIGATEELAYETVIPDNTIRDAKCPEGEWKLYRKKSPSWSAYRTMIDDYTHSAWVDHDGTGTGTVVYFGRTGLGDSCYGNPGDFPCSNHRGWKGERRQSDGENVGIESRIYFYDASVVLADKHLDTEHYAVITNQDIEVAGPSCGAVAIGTAVDKVGRRIFVRWKSGADSIIQVYGFRKRPLESFSH